MKFIRHFGQLVLGLSILLSIPAHAKDGTVTGKKDLICATRYVVACVDGSSCTQGAANNFDVSDFFYVDAKKKQIRGADKEDGSTLVSKVMQSDVTDKAYILQGFENHNGWSMGIDRTDGSYTLSLTGADVSFTIMGACTEL